MRITQRSMALNNLRGLNGQLGAVQKLQNQMTSGKTISRPSDDPTGTNTVMVTQQQLAGNAQSARNISDGTTFLDTTDSTLQNMVTQVQRARTLAVQALNSGAQSSTSLQAIATEVSGIRESLLGQANQVVQGRPIFGGCTAGSQAYNPTTGAYVGIGGANGVAVQPQNRRVSDVESIRVDTTGPEAFGDPASGKDLFAVVGNIAAHAGAGDTASLSGDLADLDKVLGGMSTALADIGTRQTRMQTAATVNQTQELSLKATLSSAQDVDLPKTIMELNMQQTGYQAALSVTAQSLQPTLLNFLK